MKSLRNQLPMRAQAQGVVIMIRDISLQRLCLSHRMSLKAMTNKYILRISSKIRLSISTSLGIAKTLIGLSAIFLIWKHKILNQSIQSRENVILKNFQNSSLVMQSRSIIRSSYKHLLSQLSQETMEEQEWVCKKLLMKILTSLLYKALRGLRIVLEHVKHLHYLCLIQRIQQ